MKAHWTEQDWIELREERAAIVEYCGKLPRKEAERLAGIEVQLMSLQAASERVQARAVAQEKRSRVTAPETRKEEQIALPGFEPVYGGG
jgi:hypothetical protein